MTAIIRWADGVVSVAEPPMISACSLSVFVFGTGLSLLSPPCHTTDGLKSLSKKMLGGTVLRILLLEVNRPYVAGLTL